MRTKSTIFISVLFLSSASFLAPGCATYSEISPGSVMEVTHQETLSPVKKAEANKSPQPAASVVEQELVTVPPLEEPAPPADYIVGPHDILYINVSGKPEFSTARSRVDGSGNIQFPFLGTVRVGGMTLVQIQSRLRELVLQYIKEPWVVVEVVEYQSKPLYLLGQFRNPGTRYMDRPLNLLQGIAFGNGFDPAASLTAARLIRDHKVAPVDINELLTTGDQRQNVWLKTGDTIYIPDSRNTQVFVFGAVKKGGPQPIPSGGITLGQAIAGAELRDSGYDSTHIRIIRSLSATRGELIVVDFDRILRGKALPFALKEGDIVYVPRNRFGTWNDAINEILPSLQAISAILQPFVQIKFLQE